ncbi:MAG: beta-galactosidase [Sedimentitalea sp.]
MSRALGVCYYPEHWPEEIWSHDAKLMRDTGITWVRIGEFAWSRLEPNPGELRFAWLDRAIEALSSAGLKVVLGTPTTTPPRWMLTRHPDMLGVDEQGNPRKFGARRHYCFSHIGYRDAAQRITKVLGDRYGRDSRIAAWQIDNEYGCHDTVLSYSEPALRAFRLWLARQYGEIEVLNEKWGNVFWSMDYTRFEDVELPNQTVTQPNPAHVLAFARFSSDQVVAFNHAQVASLRKRTDAPLLHNYMGRVLEFDHFALARELDIATWDSYPIGFLSDRVEASPAHKARYLRQGDPDMQAFHHDLYRAVGRGRWWVMEQQPGPVNWAPHNPAPLPGMVRLWSWEAFAHGAECVSYFRWRQVPFGQEQMHSGLLRCDGMSAPGLAEAAQVARELAEMPEVETAQAPVALIFDYASAWAWRALPQGADFDYFNLVFSAYRALRRAGISVDILPPDAKDLSGYRAVLAPGLAQSSAGLREAMAASGAIMVLGPRSFALNGDFNLAVPLAPNVAGLNIKVAHVETLPPNHKHPVKGGGHIQSWREQLEGTAQVLIRDMADAPVLVGNSRVWYLGGWPDDTLWNRVVALIAKACDVTRHDLPEGVRLRQSGTTCFAFNYAAEPVTFNGLTLPPAGVAWGPSATSLSLPETPRRSQDTT